jgi:hypothetical protein
VGLCVPFIRWLLLRPRSTATYGAGTTFAWRRELRGEFAAEPEKVTAMSRKSVIQLVPTPAGRSDASDLRYRLLMAALGSGEEANPLLTGPNAPSYGADEAAQEDAVADDAAPVHVNQSDPRSAEGSGAAGLDGHAPGLSLVRPQAPLPRPAGHTGNETPAPVSSASLQRPPKRR